MFFEWDDIKVIMFYNRNCFITFSCINSFSINQVKENVDGSRLITFSVKGDI